MNIDMATLNEKGYTLDTDVMGRNVYYKAKVYEVARVQDDNGEWYEEIISWRNPEPRESRDHALHLAGFFSHRDG